MNEKIYISIKLSDGASGGGANTFSWNMHRYLEKNNIRTTTSLLLASVAIVIADKANPYLLWLAKKNGCFIIHRLDEHFQKTEPDGRRIRHEKIVRINKLADVTVFQSEFVKNNVLPNLITLNWQIIINGADPTVFKDGQKQRTYVGHVTNSVGDKKRLDLLEKAIIKYPDELFLLVGNHPKALIDFSRYPNVKMTGPVSKNEVANCYQMMKCLYFPSENDPCPNTAVEAVLSGVPVCYNSVGGTVEVVRDCGLPLEKFDDLLDNLQKFRSKCASRDDLHFDLVAQKYLNLI